MHWRHWAGFGTLAFIWGTTWLGIRVVVAEVPPLGSAALRFILAAVVLGALASWQGRNVAWTGQPAGGRRLMLALSFLMIAIPYALVFWAEQHITAGLAAVLFATHSIFVVLVESLYLRKSTLTLHISLGLVLAFTGVAVIFWPQLGDVKQWGGSLAMVGSGLSSACATVLAKHKGKLLDPVVSVTWQVAAGSVWLGIAAVMFEGMPTLVLSFRAWVAMMYLSLFGSSISFVLYYWLLKKMAPIQLSTMAYLTPVVAVTFGWLILDEQQGWPTLVGAAVVLTGVSLVHLGGARWRSEA